MESYFLAARRHLTPDSLLSGGADSTISIWDLEAAERKSPVCHYPLGSVKRSPKTHKFGITDITFFPFDSLAFLSSSYDTTLKIYTTETLVPAASFALDSAIYAHATSPIADHLLVACATQHPAIRLVDLRSGASVHALAGHSGAVMTVAWSPVDEHILASGGTDGTIRFWDVRRSASMLGVLDLEDSIGIVGYDGRGLGARGRGRGRAHVGPVNGVVWTEDGRHLVSTGHDEQIRVWNTITGANTLANFGPLVKNTNLSRLLPCLAPMSSTESGKDVLFFPSEKELLMYETFEGKLIKRLKVTGTSHAAPVDAAPSGKNLGTRKVKDTAWRAFSFELYSAHADGSIRAWKPRLAEDMDDDDEEEDERKLKRQALDNIYEDLTKRRMIMPEYRGSHS
jgi:DNA excision repair protein ERCC-8